MGGESLLGKAKRIISDKLPGKKRGPKGPWKHKPENPQPPAIPAGDAGAAAAPPAVKISLPPGFLKKVVAQGISIPDEFMVRRTYGRVLKISGDDVFAKDIAKESALLEGEKSLLAESVEAVFQKYGVGDTYAPELGCLVAVVSIGARWVRIEAKLDQLERNKKRSENATDAPPDKNPGHG